MKRISCIVLALVALNAPSALAQLRIDWTKQTLQGPPARIEDTLVYDSVAQRLVMFAGYDLNWNRTNDIWEYNGTAKTWVDVTPPSGALPTRRSGQAMAFDPNRRVIIMFGGLTDGGTNLNDTWEWNTVAKTWTNVTPATSPSVRRGARMVHDALNDRMILVAGTDALTCFFHDTWAWNLTTRTWTLLSPATSSSSGRQFFGRTFAGMAYNTATNRVTVFGGIGYPTTGCSGAAVLDFNDMWELRGNTWTDVTPASGNPPARGWTQLAYDSANNRMVMLGGWSDEGQFSYGDSWAFAAGGWSQLGSLIDVRDSHGMAYDAARQRVVVFGGYVADVLELIGNTWSTVLRTDWPPGQDQHSMAYDNTRNVAFMYGGGSLESWELNVATATWSWYYVPGPNGRTGAKVVYDQARRRMVLFGGRQRTNGVSGSKLGDTWEYDLPTPTTRRWTHKTPATSPVARDNHAMAYSAALNQTVLFGGRAANGAPLGDTWLWNGTSWTNVATPPGSTPRFGHAMAYDVSRGVIVLFGGDSGTQKLNDVWEWNGAWQQKTPAGSSPPPRAYAAFSSVDAGTAGVALFGGVGASQLNDTWIWDGTRWNQASVGGAAPSPRERPAMVYAASAGRIVLYGGHDLRGISTEQWFGTITGSAPAPSTSSSGDFDGDGKADVAVFRPGNAGWYVLRSSSGYSTYDSHLWGLPGDVPLRGDFDGDGKDDVGVYRPSNGGWYIRQSSTGFTTYITHLWGLPGDVPLRGDFDGDGKADIGVYRSANGGWYIRQSSTGYTTYTAQFWGLSGDQPMPADYDGDGKADLAVYRRSTGGWYVLRSSTNYSYAAYATYLFGLPTDVPLSGDFDGDGKGEIAVYRPANAGWYVLWSSTGYSTYSTYLWGLGGDVPVPADYDGDGRTDIAVYRPANGGWYILRSSMGYSSATYATYMWGLPGDVALPGRP